jgi:hypothetical protein
MPSKAIKGKAKKQPKNNLGKGQYVQGKGFDKNPGNINMKGRPPKLLNHINDELKAEGFAAVSETNIVEAYAILLNLSEARIIKLKDSKETPYYFRKVIAYMGSNRGMEMLDRILDRAFGRVMQRQQIDSTVTVVPEPSGKTVDQEALLKEVQARLDAEDAK